MSLGLRDKTRCKWISRDVCRFIASNIWQVMQHRVARLRPYEFVNSLGRAGLFALFTAFCVANLLITVLVARCDQAKVELTVRAPIFFHILDIAVQSAFRVSRVD